MLCIHTLENLLQGKFVKQKGQVLWFLVNGEEVVIDGDLFETELDAVKSLEKEQIISELEKEVISLEKEAIQLFEENEEHFFQESMDVYFEMVEIFKSYILNKGEIK